MDILEEYRNEYLITFQREENDKKNYWEELGKFSKQCRIRYWRIEKRFSVGSKTKKKYY